MSVQGVFRALADPTRRDILTMLSRQDMTIGDVASRFTMTRAAVKKHLIILEQGGLISSRRSGRERLNHLEPIALRQVTDWLNYFSRFWDDKLTNLQAAIDADKTATGDNDDT